MMKKGNLTRYAKHYWEARKKAEGSEYIKSDLSRWEEGSFTVTTIRYAYEAYDDFFAGYDTPSDPDGNGYKTLEQAQEWFDRRAATMEVRNGRYRLTHEKLKSPEDFLTES